MGGKSKSEKFNYLVYLPRPARVSAQDYVSPASLYYWTVQLSVWHMNQAFLVSESLEFIFRPSPDLQVDCYAPCDSAPGGYGPYLGSSGQISLLIPLMFILQKSFPIGVYMVHEQRT